ncbi:MAG: methionyl-tRNA formyltransferase [Solobacterium sp.]|nr:methionyl-tRNA formyltransferase [Solobacterium sp.]
MKNIRTVFFGTSDFAAAILKTLYEEGYQIAAAVSQPNRPSGRKNKIVPTPVAAYCAETGIPLLSPEKLRLETDQVLAYEPELVVTCAYGQMVPESILNYPVHGCVNVHPSLLPKYRGGAPMHHAVWAGDEETGVCLMQMVKAMDAGRVYARTVLPIGPDETMAELNLRLQEAACRLVKEYLPLYLEGKLPGEEQDESQVVIARNIAREEEKISFQEEAMPELYNHIRSLIDWPVSYGVIDGKRIKFHKVRREDTITEAEPGTVLGFADHAMRVACRGGVLRVLELQPEGRNRMNADAFANGAGRALTGHRFE